MGNLLRTANISSLVLAIISTVSYFLFEKFFLFVMLLVFWTMFYHLCFRDIGGVVIDKAFNNVINYKRKWFQPHKWEKPLYNLFKVKSWKLYMPTFDPSLFSMEKHTFEEILMASCQAEIVHEVNMLLSLLPIILLIWTKHSLPLIMFFVISSICASLIDSLFVMIQRFNRPRMLRVTYLEKAKKSI